MKTSGNLQSTEHKIISISTNIFKTNWGERLLFIFGWKHLILRLSYSCGNNSHQYLANIMFSTIFGNYRARGSFLDYQRVSLNPLNALYQKIRRPTDFVDRTHLYCLSWSIDHWQFNLEVKTKQLSLSWSLRRVKTTSYYISAPSLQNRNVVKKCQIRECFREEEIQQDWGWSS